MAFDRFNRQVQVEIGTEYGVPLAIVHPDSLRVVFGVEKTNQPDPSKAKIEIYNLSPKTRALCEEDDLVVTVKFAYGTQPASVISVFTSTDVVHYKNGTEVVTAIEGQEGIFAWSRARIVGTFYNAGTPIVEIFKAVLNSFVTTDDAAKKGIAISPLALSMIAQQTELASSEYLQDAIVNYSKQTENGVSIHDWAWKILVQMCERHDLVPFWDSSVLHIGRDLEPMFPTPVLAHTLSGLIGVPKKLDKSRVSFTHLLDPAFRVFGVSRIADSEFINGDYLNEKVTYNLDTHGDACSVTVEAEIYS